MNLIVSANHLPKGGAASPGPYKVLLNPVHRIYITAKWTPYNPRIHRAIR